MNEGTLDSDAQSSGLTKRQLYELDLTGYVVIRRALSERQVQMINRIIDRRISGSLQGKFTYLHLDPIFFEIMADPNAMRICSYVLGPGFRFDHAFGIQYGPNTTGGGHEGLHAGPFANQGSFRYQWFAGRPYCGLLVFDYFLEPVRCGDGGLILVPGSHKLNLPLTGHDIYRDILGSSVEAEWIHNPQMCSGDLLIFTEALIHGTQRWKPQDRRRRNIHISYSPAYQASRHYDQVLKYLSLAKSATQRELLRAPYVQRFDDQDEKLGENEWRTPTVPVSLEQNKT